jgi:hypothetical protein
MNTDSDGQSGSTFDVVDWDTAMIIQGTMEGDTSETGISDTLMYFLPGPSTTTLRCTLDNSGSRNDGVAYAYILQCDDLSVTRDTASVLEGDNSYGVSIEAPSGYEVGKNINHIALEWFPGSNGEGTAHARGGLNAILLGPGDLPAPNSTYNIGDDFDEGAYNPSVDARFVFDLTFPASPSGVIVEAGATGIGMFVGFSDSGEFIARAGDGSQITSSTCARVAIPPATYDFAGRSGILTVTINMATDTLEVTFDEGGNGTINYSASDTASGGFPNDIWSGSDDGNFGDSDGGQIAGSEITSNFLFNGTFNRRAKYYDNLVVPDIIRIAHWVHISGNECKASYAFVDLSALVDAGGGPTTGQAKRWNGSTWDNVVVKGYDGTSFINVKFWDGTGFISQN